MLVAGSSSGSNDLLKYHLAVLNAVEGVTGVNDFGTEGNHSQQFGVQLYVRERPGSARQKIRVACALDKPTKLDAALVLPTDCDDYGLSAGLQAWRTLPHS